MQFDANLIYENSDNQSARFSSIGKMLNLKADTKLPSHRHEGDLANSFVDFFIDKVQRIRKRLPFATVSSCLNTCPGFSHCYNSFIALARMNDLKRSLYIMRCRGTTDLFRTLASFPKPLRKVVAARLHHHLEEASLHVMYQIYDI